MAALANKVAIVTGASAGIGEAIAEELSRAGAHVVITARRKEKLDALASRLSAAGSKVLPLASDAADVRQIHALFDRTLAWSKELGCSGRLDIAIANAGRGLAGGVLSSDVSKWEALYRLNVLGAAHFMRRAAEIMVPQQSGDIVALSSVAGHHVSPFSGFYGSSKWAITGMVEGLRREICSSKVRVTTIKPGIVLSEFQDVAGYTEENFGKGARRYGQLLNPVDVARTIRFVLEQPPHVHISELIVRAVGQDYP